MIWTGDPPRLEVHDLGGGFELDPALPPASRPRGRGLYLANAFVEDLARASKPAGGSVVSATLPVRRARSASLDPRSPTVSPPAHDPGGLVTAAARPSFRRLVAVELRKMTDTRAGAWLLVLTAVGAAAAAGVAAAVASADDQSLARFLSLAIQAAATLLPVVGTLAITSEWSERTATTTFALVPRRERVVGAKVVAALALALAATAACLLLSVVAAAACGASWDLTLAGVGGAALFLALWVLAGFAFGAVLLNTPAAIVAQFLQPVAFVALAAAIPGGQGTAHWLDLVTPVTRLGRLAEPISGHAFAQLATGAALWVLVPLVVGFARVRRQGGGLRMTVAARDTRVLTLARKATKVRLPIWE